MIAVVTLAVLAAPSPPPVLLGVAIGWNTSDDAEDAPLRYADDDAVMNTELIADLGGEAVLLSQLDRDTVALHPQAHPTPPTRAALEAALAELNDASDRAHAAGRSSELFIFYSGHGNVVNGEGYVQLQGSRLGRADFRALLALLRTDATHVVIDACKSYFLLFERGAGGVRHANDGGYATRGEEPLPSKVGLLLSTSADEDSHEWEAYQGGIFSHEVRSALRGAADFDGDGMVSYREAGAFLNAANRGIKNPRFRPDYLVRPPIAAVPTVPLVQIAGRLGDRLAVGPQLDAHYYVEDAGGLRLADFHPSAKQSFALVLPARRPLFARRPRADFEVVLNNSGSVALAALAERKVSSRARGAEHLAFREIFSAPFDEQAWQSEATSVFAGRAPAAPTRRWLLAAGAGSSAVLGGAMSWLAWRQHFRIDARSSQAERVGVNHRIDRYNAAAVSLYAVAGGCLAGYIWDRWGNDSTQPSP